MTPSDWLPLLLQTSDPLFPTGAYAHSLGLEEMVRLRQVRDEASLTAFLQGQIAPALEQFELPLLKQAHEAAVAGDVAALVTLNAELDGWKLAQELREASLQIGTRRLQMLQKLGATELLQNFSSATGGAAHHLTVYAIQGAAMPLEAVLTAYAYQTYAGHCSAALKLIRIGQEGCQRVLRTLLEGCPSLISAASSTPAAEISSFNPLLEIAAMRHQRAFERLFIS